MWSYFTILFLVSSSLGYKCNKADYDSTVVVKSMSACSVAKSESYCINRNVKEVYGGEFYVKKSKNITKWIFYSPDPHDVITLTFKEFSLGGVKCEQTMEPTE